METNSEEKRPRRRSWSWRPNKGFIGYMAVLLIFFVAGWMIVHQPWFSFGQIIIEGTKSVTEAEVRELVHQEDKVNLFTLSRSELEEKLSYDLRVEKVTTAYAWPNYLRVIITERRPAVYVKCAYGSYAKIDYNGLVLSVGNGIKDASAPFVTGYEVGNVYSGDLVKEPLLQGVLTFLSKLDVEVTQQIAEVIFTDDNELQLIMNSGLKFILGPVQELEAKVATFTVITGELKTKQLKAEYVDLTYSKPYVKLKE